MLSLPILCHIINGLNITESKFTFSNLKMIFSTGSVLAPSTFEYVYKAFGPNIHLASITGGELELP